jgi:hypothetical protein
MAHTVGRILLPLLILGCSGEGTLVDQPEQYSRLNAEFDTLAACEAARASDPFLLCDQAIVLCPNGTIAVILSDAIYGGDYTIVGDRVLAMMTAFGDLELTIGAGGALASPQLGDRPFEPTTNAWAIGECERIDR